MRRVGLLHPGAMGSTLGRAILLNGADVVWSVDQRSPASHARARAEGFEGLSHLGDVCEAASVIISICPPHGAEALAAEVAANGFRGIFVEANAIPPALSKVIGESMSSVGAEYVDGSVVGPPADVPGTTRIYLAGAAGDTVADLFEHGALEPVVLDGSPTAASALKMVYAAYTKGSGALLLAVAAAANSLGVDEALRKEWLLSIPDLPERVDRLLGYSGRKAWRFEGEMHYIAATLQETGIPDGFHLAAAEIFGRLANQRDAAFPMSPDETLSDLLKSENASDA